MKIDGIVTQVSEDRVVVEAMDATAGLRQGDIVELRARKNARTLSQNALFHVFCRFCAKWLSARDWEIKAALKNQYLSTEVEIAGVLYVVTRDTSDLSPGDFSVFYDACRAWAEEMEIDLKKFDFFLDRAYNIRRE